MHHALPAATRTVRDLPCAFCVLEESIYLHLPLYRRVVPIPVLLVYCALQGIMETRRDSASALNAQLGKCNLVKAKLLAKHRPKTMAATSLRRQQRLSISSAHVERLDRQAGGIGEGSR